MARVPVVRASRKRWPKLDALRRRIESDPAVTYAGSVEAGQTPGGNGSCRGHVALEEVVRRFGR